VRTGNEERRTSTTTNRAGPRRSRWS